MWREETVSVSKSNQAWNFLFIFYLQLEIIQLFRASGSVFLNNGSAEINKSRIGECYWADNTGLKSKRDQINNLNSYKTK